MPKKRPLTSFAREHLMKQARDARAAILLLRSSASAYFKQYESLPHRIQRLFEDMEEILKEIKDAKRD
ncbi:unnamed protein product [uncultured bacterium]|nr:unnamed protein product [uncultured bacterium]